MVQSLKGYFNNFLIDMNGNETLIQQAQPPQTSDLGNRCFTRPAYNTIGAPTAVNSSLKYNSVKLTSGALVPNVLPVLGKDTFYLDPALNSYLIFAGCATVLEGAVAVPFRSDFNFFNGGTPVNNASLYFGGMTSAINTTKNIVLIPTLDIQEVYFYDPNSNTQFTINTPSSANGGVVTWTAFADRVEVTTYATVNSAALTYAATYGIAHGILSQPYNGY